MATAEVLRTTHAIDETVTEVREQVLVVDDKVANVDNRVASVNDKITEVIIGAKIIFTQAREFAYSNLNLSDGKETNKVTKQTANHVDQVKRSSPPKTLLLRLTVSCR
jgi:hypothetical protein